MITITKRIKNETAKLRKKMRAANITSLGEAGSYIRGIARRSIKISPKPSMPGHQPHSRKGALKKAILYGVDKRAFEAVIGPTRHAVGFIGRTHEFGGIEPPKRRKRRKANFVLKIGGHGPVRIKAGREVVVAKLRTERQVARAKSLAKYLQLEAEGRYSDGATKRRRYPPRPFMGPALERSKQRLPKFWAQSVRR